MCAELSFEKGGRGYVPGASSRAGWISHSRPSVGRLELENLQAVFDDRYLASGPKTQAFERALGESLRHPYAFAVASGTCALQLALLSLAPKDRFSSLDALHDFFRDRTVLIPAYVCSGVLYAVEWTGARAVLVDVEPDTGCVHPARMAEAADEKTLAAIPAYLFGHPGWGELPKAKFAWIEDVAQCLGAEHEGVPAGSRGEWAVCSFYATKVITTGTGGMVLTRSAEAAERIQRLLQYDNQSDRDLHLSWAMDDLRASLGLAQWSRLEKMIQRRRRLAEIYSEGLAEEAWIEALPTEEPDRRTLIPGHIYYRYAIRLRGNVDRFIEAMRGASIEVKRPVFSPLSRLRNEDAKRFPNAERIFQSTVSLPLYPDLSDGDAQRVVEAVQKALASLNS